MRWLLTSPQRAQEARKERHRQQQAELLREGLLEALRPLAQALQRQDSLLLEQTARLERLQNSQQEQTEELLLEVLNSLQPPASQQLLPRLESPSSRSFPRSAS
jgi:hypothetical protein